MASTSFFALTGDTALTPTTYQNLRDYIDTQLAEVLNGQGTGVFAATDYGLVADNATDDSAAIQLAYDAAANDGGGVVVLPARDIAIGSTLDCYASNVTIRGAGPAAYRASHISIQAAAATRLKWIGVGGTMVKFESPEGGMRQNGGGLENLMLDGNNFAASVGVNIRTWQWGQFNNVYVFACAVDDWLLDITSRTLSETPYDTQFNSFINCQASLSWRFRNLSYKHR
jgi:hypothetical protein